MGRSKHRVRKLAIAPLALAAISTVFIASSSAWAEPPQALPASASEGDLKWQPAVDFDKDGCYSTPAIGTDGTVNPGLKLGGDVNGSCRDESDLRNTNVYSRSKCNNDWCAYMYQYYFEKDQAALGPGSAGHTHDWEGVIMPASGSVAPLSAGITTRPEFGTRWSRTISTRRPSNSGTRISTVSSPTRSLTR